MNHFNNGDSAGNSSNANAGNHVSNSSNANAGNHAGNSSNANAGNHVSNSGNANAANHINDGNNNSNRALAAAWINLKNAKPAFLTTYIVVAVMIAQTIVMFVLYAFGNTDALGGYDLSFGNFLYLLPVLFAIVVASRNFRKFIHLGGNRELFSKGCLIGYIILAAAVSLANCIIHATYDAAILNTGFFEGSINLLDVFGWSAHGVVVAFLRQFAFLFFVAAFTHTLSALQGSLAGWLANGALIAIICVFTPIAPLRAAEAAFFNLILTTPNALLQIVACLAIGAAIYRLSKPAFSRKAI
ncbi:MAG: hypothetical protein LBT52_02110 [Clostridiales Family XIII bacterium]|jgi:hypothetical protein|nr:hypothetical protein [Clostridiales Family XIII bacterium]